MSKLRIQMMKQRIKHRKRLEKMSQDQKKRRIHKDKNKTEMIKLRRPSQKTFDIIFYAITIFFL